MVISGLKGLKETIDKTEALIPQGDNYLCYTTKAVRGQMTKINQSDYFTFGPARADIFPVSDRVLSRMIHRVSAQDFCLLNQDGGKYERYFS